MLTKRNRQVRLIPAPFTLILLAAFMIVVWGTGTASARPLIPAYNSANSANRPADTATPTPPCSGDNPISFQLDDGTQEDHLGYIGPDDTTEYAAIWLNQFTPPAGTYPITLQNIQVFWPDQLGGNIIGRTARLLVYQDTNSDGNPSNATLVGGPVTVTIGVTGMFESYSVNITVPGPMGDIYIGYESYWAETGNVPALYPAALDAESSQGSSWTLAATGGAVPDINNLGNNDVFRSTTQLGFSGSWMVRASGIASGPNPCQPTNTPSSTPTQTPAMTDTPTATNTSTVTNTPAVVLLTGHVMWQGIAQPSVRSVRPISLTLKMGAMEVNYPPQNTDASGNFSVDVSSLPPGTWSWSVKGPQFLARCGTLTLPASGTVEMGMLVAGDANNDNRVSTLDFNIVRATFGKTLGDSGYDPRADFNNDNAVGSTDFNLLRGNFGQAGCAPLFTPFSKGEDGKRKESPSIANIPCTAPARDGSQSCTATDTTGRGIQAIDIVDVTINKTITQQHIPLTCPGSYTFTLPNWTHRYLIFITLCPAPGGARSIQIFNHPVNATSATRDGTLEDQGSTPPPTATPTNTPVPRPSSTPIPSDTPTNTPVPPSDTPTNTDTPTDSPTNTPTNTPVPPTNTPTYTRTATAVLGSWTNQAPYPIPIMDNAMVSVNGYVYSFGGASNSTIIANSYRYDPVSNVWTSIASLPAGREVANAVTDGTYIYILGGTSTAGQGTQTLYRYNPFNNTYTTLAPFNVASSAPAVAYMGGKIYKIAGCGSVYCNTFVNTVEVYNTTSNTWGTAANYPDSIGWLTAASNGSYIYAAGGIDTMESSMTFRYDPGANTWSDAAMTDLPASRWGAASTFLNGKWLLAGGYSNGVITNSALTWDTASNMWSTVSPMPAARARMNAATVGMQSFVVGGRASTDTTGFEGHTDNQRYSVSGP